MKIKSWIFNNVDKKGNVKPIGMVGTVSGITTSKSDPCTLPFCRCSPGDWVCINLGYNAKTKSVSGVSFYFDDSTEFEEFLSQLEPVQQNRSLHANLLSK